MDNRRYGLRRFTTAAIPAVLRSSATTAAFAAERAFQDIAASAAVLNAFSSPLLWSRRRDKHDEYYIGLRGDSIAITPFVEQRFFRLRSCFIEIDGGPEKGVNDGSLDKIHSFLSFSFCKS